MATMTLQEKIKEHLADYARHNQELNGRMGGTWRNGNKRYPYILDNRDKTLLNFLPGFREALRNHIVSSKIKLHTDAHHLNSSQIMCMNFFFPLMQEKKLSYVLNLLDEHGDWLEPTGQFEKISEIDGGQRGATNFDFYIESSNREKAYFEIKYTEGDFGTAKDDKRHNDKWEHIYKALIENSPILKKEKVDKDTFFKNYQLLRNMVHIKDAKTDYVVFLVPMETLYERAEKFINEVVKSEALNHVRVISWKQAFDAVKNDPQLADHYAEFEKKYLNF